MEKKMPIKFLLGDQPYKASMFLLSAKLNTIRNTIKLDDSIRFIKNNE